MRLRTVIGLGANLGDRLASLRSALHELSQALRIEKVSSVYTSAAVGGPPGQPDFLNAAVLARFDGDPAGLLAQLLAIEAKMGRVRRERWGPRTIDLDILWIEGVAIESPDLVVPHPRLLERDFALAPLLDVVPEARDPRDGRRYAVAPGDARKIEPQL